jgi:ketosteroid isomerase-like protein
LLSGLWAAGARDALAQRGAGGDRRDLWEKKADTAEGAMRRGFEDPAVVAAWKRNRDVQKRFQDAIYTRDYAKIPELLDPDFQLVEPSGLPYGGVYKGMEGFLKFWETSPRFFKTDHHEFKHSFITDDPDLIVQEIFVSGVIVATGQRFEGPMFDRFAFRDGRILSISPFFFNLPPVRACQPAA